MKTEPKLQAWRIKQRQCLPLRIKVQMSQRRIKNWYEAWDGMVYVSFSGGKDSTVLLDLVRGMYPEVPAVFVDTGLEYPEIRDFVKTIGNVVWLKPEVHFKEVLEKHGYPVVSKEQSMAISRYRKTKDPLQKQYRLNGFPNGKRGSISKKWHFMLDAPFEISEKCCDVMKKKPAKKYGDKTSRVPFTGTMAEESWLRMSDLIKHGCNAFGLSYPRSEPISFWRSEDVWEYIRTKNIPYSKIYDMGETRTGCMFCAFGVHNEGMPNRFQRMEVTHPKHHKFCMEKLGMKEVLDYMNIPTSMSDIRQLELFDD